MFPFYAKAKRYENPSAETNIDESGKCENRMSENVYISSSLSYGTTFLYNFKLRNRFITLWKLCFSNSISRLIYCTLWMFSLLGGDNKSPIGFSTEIEFFFLLFLRKEKKKKTNFSKSAAITPFTYTNRVFICPLKKNITCILFTLFFSQGTRHRHKQRRVLVFPVVDFFKTRENYPQPPSFPLALHVKLASFRSFLLFSSTKTKDRDRHGNILTLSARDVVDVCICFAYFLPCLKLTSWSFPNKISAWKVSWEIRITSCRNFDFHT